MSSELYDLIIVGTGVSGLGAQVYAERFELKTLSIGDRPGGTITLTHLVENYPGFPSLSGLELAEHFQEHVKSVGGRSVMGKVTEIKRDNEKSPFTLKTESGETYQSKAVLYATGTVHRKLGVKGEKELTNKGVSYCATCDGPLFKNKELVMVGGGDSAVKESLLLAKYGTKVTIVYRGKSFHRAEPINLKRMEQTPNIEAVFESNLVEIVGDNFVEKVILDSGKEIECQGVFIEIGRIPLTDLAKNLGVECNESGEILINKLSETNVPGFFAAGDCTAMEWKQAVVGVAEGCVAAYSASEYVAKNS